mmetsp:Transcript_5889/g.8332  ORF Transcript_5889/g.8332 Transcript_5889/m.8332 type:complete len:429 (+) Transcript_5889:122-1408(+)
MIRGLQLSRNDASQQQIKLRHVRCLLIAPGISAFFGLSISPKFFVLALIYLIAAALPLTHCLKVFNTSNFTEVETLVSDVTSTNPPIATTSSATKTTPRLTQMVNDAMRTQRSITLQFALLGICLFVYEQSRVAVVKRKESGDASLTHAAFRSAWNIIKFEHFLNLDFEPGMQRMFQWMSPIGNVYYAIMHFVAPASIMGSLILQNRDPRFQYRLSFFLMLLLALIIFTLIPTMPPRLLSRYQHEYLAPTGANASIDYAAIGLSAEELKRGEEMMKPFWKIVDTMAKSETIYNSLHGEVGNPYAAMPSMHTGWALWSALVTIETACEKRKRMWTLLGFLHVALTVFFIIVTGNHFWLDAAGGALCVYFGLFSARFLTGEFVARKKAEIGTVMHANLPLFMKEWYRNCEAFFFVPTHSTQDEKVEEVPV